MKISKVLLVSLLSLGVLVGCNQTTQDSSSNSSSSSISSVSVNSIGQLNTIKDALDYISDPNSSYEVRVDRASQIANYRWIFTPIYSYVAYNSGTDYTYAGFITTPQGIASYSLERSDTSDDVITTGEAILDANGNTVTSLYDNSTVTSLVNLDYSSLDTSSTSLKTSRRVFCESILKLANLPSSTYLNLVNGITLTVANNKLTASFVARVDGKEVQYTYTFSNFGKAKVDSLEEFYYNGGSSFVPDATLKGVRDLFNQDNYLRTEMLDDNNFAVREYFTKQYYFNEVSDSYLASYPELAAYANRGYVYLSNPDEGIILPGYTEELIYDDVYLFYSTNNTISLVTRNNPNEPGHAQGGFLLKQDDISEVMNYPKNLLLFSNMQKLVYEDGVYKTDDYNIGLDFINNFGITVPDGMTMGWTTLDMKITGDVTSLDCKVEFILNVFNATTNEMLTPYTFSFSNFGTTSYTPIDKFITDNGFELNL